MPDSRRLQQDPFDAGGRGMQHQGLRRANERAVLTLVAFNPGISNAKIARLSGLAPQTVSAILTGLIDDGLVNRGEALRGRRGQPATPVYLRADGGYGLGIEVGWRHFDVVLINMYAEVLGHVHHDYDHPDARALPDLITAATTDLVGTLPPEAMQRVGGIGVAMPTNLWRNLDLVNAPDDQAELWKGNGFALELQRRTGHEVHVFNDGNAACWAQFVALPPPRPGDVIYLLISSYVAAGLMSQGMLWEGSSGNSANLGSMLVNDGKKQQQVLHFAASLTALTQRLEASGHTRPSGSPLTWDWDSFEPELGTWLETAAAALALTIYNTGCVVESNTAIIDGALPPAIILRLVEQVRHQLDMLPIPGYGPPRVEAGHIGALAPAIGAAELPLYKRHFSRTLADLIG